MGVHYRRTLNLGNYESVQVGVMLSVPCYREEIIPVYKQVRELARAMLKKEEEYAEQEYRTEKSGEDDWMASIFDEGEHGKAE